MAQTEEHVSQAEFARRLGRSRSQVTRYKSSGLPIAEDGSVPLKQGLAWVREHVAANDGQSGDTLAGWKAQKLALECEKAELELRQQKGELIDRERAENAAFDMARQVRDAWITWVPRVAPVLAAEFGVDTHQMEQALHREVRNHLQAMSDGARSLTD